MNTYRLEMTKNGEVVRSATFAATPEEAHKLVHFFPEPDENSPSKNTSVALIHVRDGVQDGK